MRVQLRSNTPPLFVLWNRYRKREKGWRETGEWGDGKEHKTDHHSNAANCHRFRRNHKQLHVENPKINDMETDYKSGVQFSGDIISSTCTYFI